MTGHYVPPKTFLADIEYGRALDTIVKGCNDMLLTHNGKFLLARRNDWPQHNWWFAVGGRIKPGETLCDSAHRLLRRELSVDIAASALSSRMQTLAHYGFTWRVRMQTPMLNGTADISVVTTVELTDSEKASADSNTTEQREWVAAADIDAPSSSYHPCLIRTIREYRRLRWYTELETLLLTRTIVCLLERPRVLRVGDEVTDGAIVAEMSSYMTYARSIAAGDGDLVRADEAEYPSEEIFGSVALYGSPSLGDASNGLK